MIGLYFQWMYPLLLISLIIITAIAAWYKFVYYKLVTYQYSLTSYFPALQSSKQIRATLWLLRVFFLLLLAIIIAKPQLVDVKSKIQVEGIDIMLVMDLSGSMQCFDDLQDRRSRIEVAKKEAIAFIEKRENDPIGIVIFANDALSRCPLTLDKKLLKEIVQNLDVGVINMDGTLLSVGIAMAANRLKQSNAATKIMIVLTDGAPSAHDIEWQQAVEIAKKFGIKIYTVGIGNEQGGYAMMQGWGIVPANFQLNKALLQAIAQETGGRFFEAKKPTDMKIIYQTIDALEKTAYQTDLFTQRYDIYVPFLIAAILVLLIELIASLIIWFGL